MYGSFSISPIEIIVLQPHSQPGAEKLENTILTNFTKTLLLWFHWISWIYTLFLKKSGSFCGFADIFHRDCVLTHCSVFLRVHSKSSVLQAFTKVFDGDPFVLPYGSFSLAFIFLIHVGFSKWSEIFFTFSWILFSLSRD